MAVGGEDGGGGSAVLPDRRRPSVAPAAAAGAGGIAGPGSAGLVTLCAGAIVVGALYLGRDLLVPLVLAVLLAFVLARCAACGWGA